MERIFFKNDVGHVVVGFRAAGHLDGPQPGDGGGGVAGRAATVLGIGADRPHDHERLFTSYKKEPK